MKKALARKRSEYFGSVYGATPIVSTLSSSVSSGPPAGLHQGPDQLLRLAARRADEHAIARLDVLDRRLGRDHLVLHVSRQSVVMLAQLQCVQVLSRGASAGSLPRIPDSLSPGIISRE